VLSLAILCLLSLSASNFIIGSEEREQKLQSNLKLSEDENALIRGQLKDRESL